MWQCDKRELKKCTDWLTEYDANSKERERLATVLQLFSEAANEVQYLQKENRALREAGILCKQMYNELMVKYLEAKEQLDLFDDDLK